MITLGEARERLLAAAAPTDSESLCLGEAAGRVLAEPAVATRTQPPGRTAAMDGYAIHHRDLREGRADLTLVGEAQAGRSHAAPLDPGTALRVSTGAPLPERASQVVVQEACIADNETVRVEAEPKPNHHIREAGVDFATGDTLLPAGRVLDGRALALMAASNLSAARVHRRPRIAVLATGNELVMLGTEPGPDKLIDSVSHGLGADIARWGGEAVMLGIAPDDPEAIKTRLAAAQTCDVLVTIGAASVGPHDHLQTVFRARGGRDVFRGVAMKPGKPAWFGHLGGLKVLGLPGNPVSALVTAHLLLQPLIKAMTGQSVETLFFTSVAAVDLPPARVETYMRGQWVEGENAVAPLTNQDTSALSALARADVLIRRETGASALAAGERVDVVIL